MSTATTLADEAREFFAKDELPGVLSWVRDLSPVHARLFAVELNAALASPQPDAHQLAALLDAWRATAELDASPELRETIAANRKGPFENVDEWLSRGATR